MARNNGILILGLLGLAWLVSKPKNGSNGGGFFNGFFGSRPSTQFSYVARGYPAGYARARARTWEQYGSGESAQIPAIQDVIEQKRISTPAPRTARQQAQINRARVSEVQRQAALRKTQAQYGKGSTGKIPVVQDLIESRRY